MHLLLLFRSSVGDDGILLLLVMFVIEMKSDKGPICSCVSSLALISTVSSSLLELDIDHGYPNVSLVAAISVAYSDELEIEDDSVTLLALDDEDCMLSKKMAATTTRRRTMTTVAKYTILRLCSILALSNDCRDATYVLVNRHWMDWALK